MAAATVKYGQNAVYGSLAYDFNNPELYPEIEYGSPLERPANPAAAERTKVRADAHAAAQTRTKQGVAPMAVVGILVAAVLFVIAIMAQVQVVEISGKSVALANQLNELEMEQAKLKIAYESAFNLTEIEDYAITQLGMQKPNADQIYYIDTSSPDRAVVVLAGGDGFVDRVSDFISGLGVYFH